MRTTLSYSAPHNAHSDLPSLPLCLPKSSSKHFCTHLSIQSFLKLPTFSLTNTPLYTSQNEANELSPLNILQPFLLLTPKSSATTLSHAFLCLPLQGLVSHSQLNHFDLAQLEAIYSYMHRYSC